MMKQVWVTEALMGSLSMLAFRLVKSSGTDDIWLTTIYKQHIYWLG